MKSENPQEGISKRPPRSDFIQDLMDLDAYFPKDGKWLSIKQVFDNLRCYPILAIYGFVIGALSKNDGIVVTIALYFFLAIFLLIVLATLFQTAVMFAVIALGIASTFIRFNEGIDKIVEKPFFRKMILVSFGIVGLIGLVTAFIILGAVSQYLKK